MKNSTKALFFLILLISLPFVAAKRNIIIETFNNATITAMSYFAGYGLQLSGNTFSVDTATVCTIDNGLCATGGGGSNTTIITNATYLHTLRFTGNGYDNYTRTMGSGYFTVDHMR